MPYTKKAMDSEGARAEAIGTELTFLTGLTHPAKDKPEISTDGNKVVLPELNLRYTFSDYLFDGSVSNKGKNFMESLGKVIAFNWYIGQADLNITNISVQNVLNKACYPYNFDCCFQNIQSESSFAKQRMKDVSYETVDLDAQTSGPDVIHAALINLRNSAKVSGVDTADFDKLFDPENLSAITQGFNEQLMKISKLPSEQVSAVVDKHTPKEEEREVYKQYLSGKSKQAKEMAVDHIKELLKGYTSRIEATGFDHDFSVMVKSQAKNREINYKLAKKYLEDLESGKPVNFDQQAVLNEREKIRVATQFTGSNTIRSDELHEIFSLAANLTPNSTNRYKTTLKGVGAEEPSHEGVVAKVIKELPSNLAEIPPDFLQLDPQEVFNQINEQAVNNPPVGYQVKSGTEVTKELLADLNRLKDRLGGAPNFRGGIPTLDDQDAHRTFLGQPMPAVKDWFHMTLKQEWPPKFFWNFVARQFNVTNNSTPYEEAHTRIQRFGILSANKKAIFEILDSKDSSRYIEFSTMTGLAWHPADNGSGIEKFYMNMTDDFLTIYYEDAKARGDDALIEYFNAYSGVCFEDRAKKIEKYMATHPILTMEAEAQGEDEIPADAIADYNSETPINQVLYKECGELSARKGGEAPTPQELWEHLVKKGVNGKEFPNPDGSGEKVKITAEYLNSDEIRSDLIEIVMILEDGPKIVEQPQNMDSVADWSSDTPIQDVIFQEIQELSAIKGNNAPTPQELWDRLEIKGITDKEFPVAKGSGEKVALTAEYLNQDTVRENLIEEYMVLDDGPKIAGKFTAPDELSVQTVTEDLDDNLPLIKL